MDSIKEGDIKSDLKKTSRNINIAFVFVVVLTIAVAIIGMAMHNRYGITIVVSDSMSPAIKVLSPNIIKYCKTDDALIGDVVLYRSSSRGINVIHRVVDVKGTGNDRALVVRGDNNDRDDSELVTNSNIIGKLKLNLNCFVPLISYLTNGTGYYVSFVKLFLGVVYAVGFIILLICSISIVYYSIRRATINKEK